MESKSIPRQRVEEIINITTRNRVECGCIISRTELAIRAKQADEDTNRKKSNAAPLMTGTIYKIKHNEIWSTNGTTERPDAVYSNHLIVKS